MRSTIPVVSKVLWDAHCRLSAGDRRLCVEGQSTEDGGGGSYGCGGRTVSEGHSAAWHPARPLPPTPREQPTPTPAPTSHFRSSPTLTQLRTGPP
ncbi:hypothetical protein E2C01_050306 [Portunus trituberculatus]|uniref:Uncharacterized protein n=1 Tax=Portunus trituberculatus TaxID=210409 RepID=A0A5B7GFR6_PORTR|nr:hypothetical protein [Portunus trituberculatus]